ncbi:MAG: glyoxalase superfamily protein [archaeon]
MKVKKTKATVLFVADLKRSLEFYSGRLGFEKSEESDDFANLVVGNHNVALLGPKTAGQLLGNARAAKTQNSMIAIEVDGVDNAHKELVSKGVKFLKPPALQPWGQYAAYFCDPNGHIWEIFEWKK